MIRPLPLIASVALLSATATARAQTLTTLYDFGAGPFDGEDPQSGVVFDDQDNLWGMTTLGGNLGGAGTIFRLEPPDDDGPWTEVIIHRLRGAPDDGDTPESRPFIDADGLLYGTSYFGGAIGMGSALQAIPPRKPGDSWIVRVIHDFGTSAGDGMNPNASLVLVEAVFYGVTQNGGDSGRGTVFSLEPLDNPRGEWIEAVVYSFEGLPDAAFPSGALTADAAGNLYGNALQGGANNLGAVFQLSPQPGGRWMETVVHAFDGDDGTLPIGRLVIDGYGALYGTTSGGGAGQAGTVFRLTPPATPGDPWTHEVLYSFSGGRDGGSPQAGVSMDRRGRLFGTAANGGNGRPDPGGVVFALHPPSAPDGEWMHRVLHAFGGRDGFRPIAPLILRHGLIYGTTAQGGAFGAGTAFVLSPQ